MWIDADKDLDDKDTGKSGTDEQVVVEEQETEDTGDERVVRGGEEDDGQGGTDEERRQRNREARRKKKERHRQLWEDNRRLEAMNSGLQEALGQVNARLQRLEQRTVDDMGGRIDRAMAGADNALSQAEASLKRALADQDADAIVAANRDIARITVDKTRLEDRKSQFEESRQSRKTKDDDEEDDGVKTRRAAAPDPLMVRNFQVFRSRFSWYDPSGRDEESRIVKAIDEGVASDGYDPRTKEYWEELQDRIADRLPSRAWKESSKKNGAAIPDMTGGSGRDRNDIGGGKGWKLSQARVEAMKEANIWEDPEARKKQIEAYKRYDKDASDKGAA